MQSNKAGTSMTVADARRLYSIIMTVAFNLRMSFSPATTILFFLLKKENNNIKYYDAILD